MAVYSHSRISSYEQCKYRYKLRYIDKVKSPVEKSIEAHLGTCVHDTLEWLYKEILEKRLPEMDEVLQRYAAQWNRDYKSHFLIVKKQFCAEDYKNKGVKFIIDYFVKHTPFIDGTISMEEKVWVNLGEEFPHKVIGFIDRLVYNKEKNEYEIHDYKTANSLPTQKKFDQDRQLALYAIAIKEKYGREKSILLTWHYLNHNKQIFSRRTDEQFEKLKEDIKQKILEIEENQEFPCTKSILCDWCEYKMYCKGHGNQLPEQYRQKQTSITEHTEEKKEIQTNPITEKIKIDTTNFPTASKYIK